MSRVASTIPPEGAQVPERHPKAPPPGSIIPSHFGHCFGCGDLHPTGLHLVATAGEAMDLTATFTVTLSRNLDLQMLKAQDVLPHDLNTLLARYLKNAS